MAFARLGEFFSSMFWGMLHRACIVGWQVLPQTVPDNFRQPLRSV